MILYVPCILLHDRVQYRKCKEEKRRQEKKKLEDERTAEREEKERILEAIREQVWSNLGIPSSGWGPLWDYSHFFGEKKNYIRDQVWSNWGIPPSGWDPLWGYRLFLFFPFLPPHFLVFWWPIRREGNIRFIFHWTKPNEEKVRLGWCFAETYLWTIFMDNSKMVLAVVIGASRPLTGSP